MSEMIERVARAIYECNPDEDCGEAIDGFQVTPGGPIKWETIVECYELVADHCREQAGAAITAMREPTDEMIAAFHATLEWMSDTPLAQQQRMAHADETRRRWRLLIDAALADESLTAPAVAKTATGA